MPEPGNYANLTEKLVNSKYSTESVPNYDKAPPKPNLKPAPGKQYLGNKKNQTP